LMVLFIASPVVAVHPMTSDSYQIDWPNLNMGAGVPSSGNYGLGVTTGQIAPGLYSSTGYKVRAGFQYIHSIIPFVFKINKIAVDFNSLTVGTPSTDTIDLEVDCGGAGGYALPPSPTLLATPVIPAMSPMPAPGLQTPLMALATV